MTISRHPCLLALSFAALALVPAARADGVRLIEQNSVGVDAYDPNRMEVEVGNYVNGMNAPVASQNARSYYGSQRTYNVAVIGDGYLWWEKQRFDALFMRSVRAVTNSDVIRDYNLGHKIVFYPVFVPSQQQGATHLDQSRQIRGYAIYRQTALNATYVEASPGDTTLRVNFDRAWGYARYVRGVDIHAVLVLVNDGTYAATNWTNRVCVIPDFGQVRTRGGNISFEDILAHEFIGHTIAGLWDEYVYDGHKNDPTGYAANCSPSGRQPYWGNLVGYQWLNRLNNYVYVGAYPGCTNMNYVRPVDSTCKMNSRSYMPFCLVCYHRIYAVLTSF